MNAHANANVRVIAAHVLGELYSSGHSLNDLLSGYRDMPSVGGIDSLNSSDHGLLLELSHGVCRHHFTLQAWLEALLNRPLDARQHTLKALLHIGLYQLAHLRIPPHAAVAETVSAASPLGYPWATGLVNAILRNFERRRAVCDAHAASHPVSRTAHPTWLLHSIQRDWPKHADSIIAANNVRPPMVLRIDTRRIARTAYLYQLAAAGITADPIPDVPTAIVLDRPQPVHTLPSFEQGLVSIQDGSAQCAIPLLAAEPGMRILDACAAPGGKTGHLLQAIPDVHVTAIEPHPQRYHRLQDTLQRLSVQAQCHLGDATRPTMWWDRQPYDRILLDAPCSGTGVLRRHPDIKLLRRPQDIPAAAQQQGALLTALWPLLKSGGQLLYTTCSLLTQENDGVIATFLAAHRDAHVMPIAAPWGYPLQYGRQIFPGEQNMDGFYFARLVKRA